MKSITSLSRLNRIAFPVFLAFFLAQCKKADQSATLVNPAFTEKIAAFTSGIVSSESVIQIVLAEDYPGTDMTNAPAGEGLFRFKPAVDGQAVWVDKRTIEFRPAGKLKSGETYSV
jgi:hypothetical protein